MHLVYLSSLTYCRYCAADVQVCETLDRRKGITEDVMWPVEPKSESDKEDDEVEEDSWEALPVAEKLADVLSCLRSRHLYCLFCGCEVGVPACAVMLARVYLASC